MYISVLQIQDTHIPQQQPVSEQPQQEVQISQNLQQYTEMNGQGSQVASTQELNVVTGSQQGALGALQASINSAGHIILTGADASQLGGNFVVIYFSGALIAQVCHEPIVLTLHTSSVYSSRALILTF